MRKHEYILQRDQIEMVTVHYRKDRIVRVPLELLSRNMREASDKAEAREKKPGEPVTNDRSYHRMSFDDAAVAQTINQTIGPKIKVPLKLW